MPSGRKLTDRDRAEIHRLLRQRDADGRWLFRVREIATRLGLHPTTVHEYMRQAAVSSGEGPLSAEEALTN